MADRDDKSGPQTLAGLWLRSRPARRQPPPDESSQAAVGAADSSAAKSNPAASRSGESQMGLLFASAEIPEAEVTPAPRKAARTRREATSDPVDATAKSPTAKPKRRTSLSRAAAAPQPIKPERRIWTVRDLVTGVRQQLEREYADIWVEGEISNCRAAPSGHIYFTLKDGEAQLPVVLFRRQAMLLRFQPQDGLAILARGRVSVYESRGQLQLIAETLEPRGAGALQLAYEQLKTRLLAEGLFDAARKRPLPAFPRTVGVITSTAGAVLHDIIKVTRRRHARLNLLVYPATVQGPGCAASVIAGIDWFNRIRSNAHPGAVDVILIARGGGSLEDLAGFNDESLARAIAASKLPIVSAVGHETDFTIADFVADLRAPTPSAAAELITAAQHRIEERIQSLDARVYRAIRYQLILARQRFSVLSAAQVLSRVRDLIGRRGQRLDDLRHRMESASTRRLRAASLRYAALAARLDRQDPSARLALTRRQLEACEQSLSRLAASAVVARSSRLDRAIARLQALSPVAVLNRGYALVYLESRLEDGTIGGRLLYNAADVRPGETIRARLAAGSLTAEVKTTKSD